MPEGTCQDALRHLRGLGQDNGEQGRLMGGKQGGDRAFFELNESIGEAATDVKQKHPRFIVGSSGHRIDAMWSSAEIDQVEAIRHPQEAWWLTAYPGVARSIADAIARFNFLFVIAAFFRRWHLICENAFSIGLRSGQWGGRKIGFAPADWMIFPIPAILCIGTQQKASFKKSFNKKDFYSRGYGFGHYLVPPDFDAIIDSQLRASSQLVFNPERRADSGKIAARKGSDSVYRWHRKSPSV